VTHATSGHNGEDNALTVGLSPKVVERSRSLDMHSAWPRVMTQLKGSFKTIDNRFVDTMDTPSADVSPKGDHALKHVTCK
jgi:hypothetical protein